VRMAELSRLSGVPVATIKYYLREGLLPPGERTAPNQARYDECHLERLELIRALREGAGLGIATLARVFRAMEDHRRDRRPEYLMIAIGALSEPRAAGAEDGEALARARADVDRLLDELGWDADRGSPAREDLARALASVHRFMPGLIGDVSELRAHAEAMRAVAEAEIPDDYSPDADPAAALRFAVLGTVLFEPVLLALRKLAHSDRARELRARGERAGAGPDGSRSQNGHDRHATTPPPGGLGRN
jgi:DNA-binding transcriptional MerR regulator